MLWNLDDPETDLGKAFIPWLLANSWPPHRLLSRAVSPYQFVSQNISCDNSILFFRSVLVTNILSSGQAAKHSSPWILSPWLIQEAENSSASMRFPKVTAGLAQEWSLQKPNLEHAEPHLSSPVSLLWAEALYWKGEMFSADITHTLEVRKQNMLPPNTITLNFLVLHPYPWEGNGVTRRNELSSSKFCCFYASYHWPLLLSQLCQVLSMICFSPASCYLEPPTLSVERERGNLQWKAEDVWRGRVKDDGLSQQLKVEESKTSARFVGRKEYSKLGENFSDGLGYEKKENQAGMCQGHLEMTWVVLNSTNRYQVTIRNSEKRSVF